MPVTPAVLPHARLQPDVEWSQAGVAYFPDWLGQSQGARLLQQLLTEIDWQQHRVHLFGRWHDCPRLSAWQGDEGAHYNYSGQSLEPGRWTPGVAALRTRLQDDLAERFNSVLLNRYRNGQDAMGWHSDNERSLGPEPTIASISLGAERKFSLRSRAQPRRYHHLTLRSGSLLVMAGRCQQDWQHQLPRSRRVNDERINLTFRLVQSRG